MDADAVRRQLELALDAERQEFGKFFLFHFFGLEVAYGEESCTVSLPGGEHLANPQGMMHGGVIAFALDVSMGHLCHHFLSTAVTLSMSVQYLRPIRGAARCEARFLKKGRRVIVVESRMTNDEDKLAAVGTGTWHRLEPETTP